MNINLVLFVVILFITHWYASLFCQSFFNHRYMTHLQFSMTKSWERFFYILAFMCQGSSYLSARTYVVMHRMHHAYSDDEQDPHSPRFFLNSLQLLWNMKLRYAFLLILDETKSWDEKDALAKKMLNAKSLQWYYSWRKVNVSSIWHKLPRKSSFDTFADAWYCRFAWGLLYAVPYYAVASYIANNDVSAWHYLLCVLYPFHFIMGPIHGTIVNWFGHKHGYQNFNNGDDSTNCVLWWDLFLLGELFQNNHHHSASSPNFAMKKGEFDPLYPILLLLRKCKIIYFKT